MLYPNGVTHGFGFDNRDRATSLNVAGPGGLLASYSQNYSFSGHKQSVAEGTGRAANYTYDSIYRLTNESIAGDPGGVNGTLGYSLDAVANRINLTSTLAALPSQALSYDAADRLSSDTYDANGNTLISGGTSYGYEFEDRLTSTSSGVQIAYDGDGNRISETVSGTTTKFLVDELTPTGFAQVAEELVNSAVTVQYTHGVMRTSQRRAGVASYYGHDIGGSVRQLTDAAGAMSDTYSYDAFGNLIVRTGMTASPYQYRGEQVNSALGLYYLRARWYRPRIGRFLTMDSAESSFDESQWNEIPIHPYAYAKAEPVNLFDPSGHAAESAIAYRGSQTLVDLFIKSIAVTALGYCLATEVAADPRCREINSGKIQAQGEIFGRGAGIGYSIGWSQPFPPFAFQGITMLSTVWALMQPKEHRALDLAIAKAAKWIGKRPGMTPPGRSFFNDYDGSRRTDAPPGANRIDIDVFYGSAFDR